MPANNDDDFGVPPATVAEDPIPDTGLPAPAAARPNRGATASLDATFGLNVLTVPNLGFGPDDEGDDDCEALRSLSC